MNNLHVPVGLLLNLLIWNQHEPLGRLALGGLVISASALAEYGAVGRLTRAITQVQMAREWVGGRCGR